MFFFAGITSDDVGQVYTLNNLIYDFYSLNSILKIDHWNAQVNDWYGWVEVTHKVLKWGTRSKSHGGNQKFCPFFHFSINKQNTKSGIAHVWVMQND